VTLKELLPNTVYFYKYGSEDGWSDLKTFRSRGAAHFRGIMFGDLGVGDGHGLAGPSSK
jgi:hypothetical protein